MGKVAGTAAETVTAGSSGHGAAGQVWTESGGEGSLARELGDSSRRLGGRKLGSIETACLAAGGGFGGDEPPDGAVDVLHS